MFPVPPPRLRAPDMTALSVLSLAAVGSTALLFSAYLEQSIRQVPNPPTPSSGLSYCLPTVSPEGLLDAVICTDTGPIGILSVEFWCAGEGPAVALIRRDRPEESFAHSLRLETTDGSASSLPSRVSSDLRVIWLLGGDPTTEVASAILNGTVTVHLPELSATYAIGDAGARVLRHRLPCLAEIQ